VTAAGGSFATDAGQLAAALALIDRLPLTDAEKADAVRRLLARLAPENTR
jgi:hypothetical protein